MVWVVAGIVLLGLILLFARWYVDAEPRDVLRVLKFIGILFALVVIGVAIASGRIGMLWLVLLGLLPWIGRLRALMRQSGEVRGPVAGQRVDRRTDFVVIYLNSETGDMDGRVLQGPQRGKLLSELSVDALVTLYEAAVLEDAESAAILEAYLDRMHGSAWRQKSKTMDETEDAHSTMPDGQKLLQARMSRAEAYHVLGLAPGASKSDIESAFNHLVQTGHPNEDVAKEIASKAECAKSILIDE
jgi:hypothetical protein